MSSSRGRWSGLFVRSHTCLNRQVAVSVLSITAAVFLSALPAWGQTGSIAGSVKDTSQAVLPGVTVEASSPALIEKVRTVVTDAQGEYRIIDLRPGTYTITFAVSGFSTVKREGIVVAVGTTATVQAELSVGAVNETIVVTGATPLVDVQNATQQRAITRTDLDALPTGRQVMAYGSLVPGAASTEQDVGGGSFAASIGLPHIGIHGGDNRDMLVMIEGMRAGNVNVNGACGTFKPSDAIIEEFAIGTGAAGAEQENAGLQFNIVLKQGGNRFSSTLDGSFSGDSLQSDNIDDRLRALGVTQPLKTNRLAEVFGGVGGPIQRDHVWFYGAYRGYRLDQIIPGAYHAQNPLSPIFVPNVSQPSVLVPRQQSVDGRVTWQASAKNKVSLYTATTQNNSANYGTSSTRSYEASPEFLSGWGGPEANDVYQVNWSWTASNRLLLQVGETFTRNGFAFQPKADLPFGIPGVLDAGTGIISRAPFLFSIHARSRQNNEMAVLNYVTGSHHLKVGSQWYHGWYEDTRTENTDPAYAIVLFNGFPVSILQMMEPFKSRQYLGLNLGLFVQEQYTRGRLTLNAGLRYDHLNAYLPAQTRPAIAYGPALNDPEVDNIPNWNDLNPRLSVAYDLFGKQKTALKGSLSRYVEAQGVGIPAQVDPMRSPVGNSTTRGWVDANRNFVPDCNLTNFRANGECAPIDNSAFGQPIVPVSYDPGTITGWGNRVYNWEVMGGIQHEVRPGFAVEAAYYRRWYGNVRVTANTALAPADFDPFCVTTPVDPRLPGGGNQQICGFYNVKPTAFGRQNVLLEKASNFGDVSQVYNGFDVTMNMRLPRNLTVQGGVSVGRTEFNLCGALIGHPEITDISIWGNGFQNNAFPQSSLSRTEAFCDMKPKFIPSIKLQAVYPLPWGGVQTSLSFQSERFPPNANVQAVPGILATRAFTNAEIAPSLGRSLAGGTQTMNLQMVPAGSLYFDRLNQLDLRLARPFRVGTAAIEPFVDLYNLFNSNAQLQGNYTYGSAWLSPGGLAGGLLAPRLVKIGGRVSF